MIDPRRYVSTFDLLPDGREVLAELVAKFCGPLWSDSPDTRTRNIAHREVIEFIHQRIEEGARHAQGLPTNDQR